MLPVEVAVYYRNGGSISVKGINQGRDFSDPCLLCGVQAAVTAYDLIFLCIFYWSDDQRRENALRF